MSLSSSVRRANLSKRVATSSSSRLMPTPCTRCARLGSECRVDLSSGRCSECIRVGRKAGKSGCDLVVTDEDWGRLLSLRKRVREELERLGEEDDQESAEFERLSGMVAALVAKQQLRKRKRRRLEAQFLKLHAEQGEMVDRELGSIEEMEKLEVAAKAKETFGASSLVPEGAVPLSTREALAEDDLLNFLDPNARFLEDPDPVFAGCLDGTVEFAVSPSAG